LRIAGARPARQAGPFALAPRRLIYAHEFAWDKDRDPVWKRFETIYGFYQAQDRLSSTHGEGSVRGTGPGNTHCNNIGPEHRAGMYPALKQWFDMPIPEKEYRKRLPAEILRCWTPVWEKKLQPKPLHEIVSQLAETRLRTHRSKGNVSKSRAMIIISVVRVRPIDGPRNTTSKLAIP